jgi:MFS family permease
MSKHTKVGLTPKANRILVMLESMLTGGIISVPFMTILYEMEIGLTHEQIALTQAAFTVVAMLLNVPLGWVADRFSRKAANIVGDLLCLVGLILYSGAQSMLDCVVCETLFGVGMAFSQGVDSSLLKHFADKEDSGRNHKLFKDSFGLMSSLCQLACFAYYLIGFAIGGMNVREIILISAIPYVAAIIAGLFIQDDSEKLEKSDESPFKTMGKIAKSSLKNPELNVRIAAFIVAREMTHGIIWCFTPLMQSVGIDGRWIVLGWAANSAMAYVGTKIARKFNAKLPEWLCFALPVAVVSLAALTMSFKLTAATLALYVLFGLAQGWTSVTMMPNIKTHVSGKKQVTVESFAKVCSQLYYIIAVWVIGWAADITLEYAALATVLLFAPIAIPITFRLKYQEASEKKDLPSGAISE